MSGGRGLPGHSLTRRRFLAIGAGALAGSALAGRAASAAPLGPHLAGGGSQAEALRVLGRSTLRLAGSRPYPALAAGTDTLPGIEHIVVLMLENHSYDNFLGMLGRGPGQRPRGDGFTLGANGLPMASNPYGDGRIQHAFHLPTTCQLAGRPSQEWAASHNQYNNGRLDGFVTTPVSPGSSTRNGPVAMGYWTGADLPFTYSLAAAFPLCDRYFASALAQTDPNRRFLIAATSSGMTDDIGTGPGNIVPDATLPLPANGTIFTRLSAAGISYTDYSASYPAGATGNLYPLPDGPLIAAHNKPLSSFFTDAANDALPGFSLLDPNFGTQSQENPQNIVVGEALLAQVVGAIGSSPAYQRILFVLTYDEHGGYYDHVPPPVALAPDAIPPTVQPGESMYDGFARYGFRVPTVVVSAYAKPDYVSHVVYDHTSILALIERKWNLASLTLRDANANDLTDCLDLTALARLRPTFGRLPVLAPSGDNARTLACATTGTGTIPPAGSITGPGSGSAAGSGTPGSGGSSGAGSAAGPGAAAGSPSGAAAASDSGSLAFTGGLPGAGVAAALVVGGTVAGTAVTRGERSRHSEQGITTGVGTAPQ